MHDSERKRDIVSKREKACYPNTAVAVAVVETEAALVIYINPIIAWRFPN